MSAPTRQRLTDSANLIAMKISIRGAGLLSSVGIANLFSSDAFMPHGHCFLWQTDILWLNVVSDIVIALAYYAIPFALIYFVHKRGDLVFDWVFLMFATFIVACGTTHLFDIVTIWQPYYGVQGLVKLITAAVSIATAITLWRLMPKALRVPSAVELDEKNRELRALNEQLRLMSDTRLRQVIEAAPNGLLMVNQKGEIVLCNAEIESLFGYAREELLGKKIEILIPARFRNTHPHHRSDYFLSPETRQMGAGRDLTGLRKDGTEFPVEIGLNPVRTDEGQSVLASIVDITERQKIAQALLEAKEAAETANLAKSAFLANMSHEIRTPLGAILGFADLVVDPQSQTFEKANFVAAIKRNGELLSTIINDILDLSKVEAGKMEISVREATLADLLTDTKTMLDLQAKDKGIALNIDIDPNVPKTIKTDPLRLRQILINIIGNAIKFTAKGAVSVRIQPEGSRLAFVVKDTGRGIQPDQVGKLFTPFSQVDATSKRKYGGTGLGLVLSRRLAVLLGGDVVLSQTEPNRGSTFVITIDPGPALDIQSSLIEKGAPVMQVPGRLRLDGVKVLLAEDAPDNQVLVSHILRIAGASVEIASNGQEAIEKAGQDVFDVLLMDLQMPIIDGYEATAELRQRGYTGKILALTAHALTDERERCLRSGFDEHISKPINREALIERVDHFSKMHRDQQPMT